ncbi:MAG: cytochrome oxidase subunit III [Cytophagia bacterium]|nr:cytochrome oxidase subunit III [Cytophagia bacterium]
MKNKLTAFILLLLPAAAWAQETTAKGFWDDPINHPMTPFYALMALVLIVTILVFVVAIMLLQVLNTFVEKAAREKAAALGVEYKPEPSWWQKLDRKLTNAIPLEKEATIELDHNYDGIKELDNHLPPWWKWLFYGTIAWSVVYLVVYHITDSVPLQQEEYNNEVALADEQIRKIRAAEPVAAIDEAALTYTADADLISKGALVFKNNCVSCHKEKGEGSIGPNLTDEYWLHGGSIQNIFATVKNGVPEKGMIAWNAILKPEEIRNVSLFIMSLKGSNPPNAKAPQGVIWKEEVKTESVQTDSLKTQASL